MYTVKQLSDLAGVSVRTLHYYDQIGLLKPTEVKGNGYRMYGQKELIKLQQILFFKELDFPLEKISEMVNSSNFNTLKALEDQNKLLTLKLRRTINLIKSVDETLRKLKGGGNNMNDDFFSAFTDDSLDKFKEEVKEKWGNTKAYKQSVERTENWTKEDYNRIAKQGKEFTKKLAENMDKGFDSPEFQELVNQHYAGIQQFYDCPLEVYKGIGEMYVTDSRFTAYYDDVKPGLAKFMKEAIDYYVASRSKLKEGDNK